MGKVELSQWGELDGQWVQPDRPFIFRGALLHARPPDHILRHDVHIIKLVGRWRLEQSDLIVLHVHF